MKLDRFFFAPGSPLPLAVLRISVTSILLIQAALIAPNFYELYGAGGIFQGPLQIYFSSDTVPGVVSFARWMDAFGMSEPNSLRLLGCLYVASLLFLLVGLATRLSSILVWFTHLLIAGAHVTSYGVDLFSHFLLFYFTWMPVGHALSVDKLWGRVSGEPTAWARFSLRVLQLHLAIAYLFSGVDKAVGEQWQNGEAIWRSLMMPIYAQFDFSWIASVPWLAKIFAWGTLLVEIGYPFFIFPRRTRALWIFLTVSMHVGIGLFLGLHMFAALMSVLTLSLFAVPAGKVPGIKRYHVPIDTRV